MSLTHYPESAAGPAERRYSVDCQTCHKRGESTEECANCYEALCDECCVRCAECGAGKEPFCPTCALRCGFAKRTDDQWFCENDFEEAV